MKLVGGIEAGGTKFVCTVGTGPEDIRAEVRFPTTTPQETILQAVNFFREEMKTSLISAIGIGSFGPIDLHPGSPTWGYITSTPKPGWRFTDLCGPLSLALDLPVAFDTDVNAAALAEMTWGAAQGLNDLVYYTIGTGIGAGIITNGKMVHGLVHTEMGHMLLPHDRMNDPYGGFCPYHGDCFEGLAAGPAIQYRWETPASSLPPDHPAWTLEAEYISLAMMNTVCSLSPQRIILGGGVMQQPQLFPLIRKRTVELINGYVQSPAIQDHPDTYLVPPGLGNRSGMLGALALAYQLLEG
ncbi:MAG: ROK family protein [Anaerolineaceae bacterium]